MNYKLVEILSYLIGISAIIGLVRYKKTDRAYYPFIILLWAGLFNEIISSLMIEYFRTNAINSNVYLITEACLILWFFRRLHLFTQNRKLYYIILIAFILSWLLENFYFSFLNKFNSYFSIIYSFVVVLMSIHKINSLIITERKKLLRNPIFLIMVSFVIFFTYKALIEIFWVYGLNASREFRIDVYRILTYINLVVNIIFILAVLWMPRRREFTWL